jgi:probable rRNA maturation factor
LYGVLSPSPCLASSPRKSYHLAMPVEIVRRDAGKQFPSRRLKRIATSVLELLKQHDAELSVALVGNTEIRKLNAQFRKKDYPTDVLSFPAQDGVPTVARLLGDVVISVDKAKQQAQERKRTLDEEMITLMIHGVLHLLGYDHERSAKDARIMTRLEKRIYRTLCEQGILQV